MLPAAKQMHRDSYATYYRAYLCFHPKSRELLDELMAKKGGTKRFSPNILKNYGKLNLIK